LTHVPALTADKEQEKKVEFIAIERDLEWLALHKKHLRLLSA
jgi:hypothetical protein